MGKKSEMTVDKLDQIIEMYSKGVKATTIADWMGCSDTNIMAYIRCAERARNNESIGVYHVNMRVLTDWCEKHGCRPPRRGDPEPQQVELPAPKQAEPVNNPSACDEQIIQRLDEIKDLLRELIGVWTT